MFESNLYHLTHVNRMQATKLRSERQTVGKTNGVIPFATGVWIGDNNDGARKFDVTEFGIVDGKVDRTAPRKVYRVSLMDMSMVPKENS